MTTLTKTRVPFKFWANRLRTHLKRLRQRLWFRPLTAGIVSVAGVFVARIAGEMPISRFVPTVTPESVDVLLSVMAASMLVIATFSVASMVSAYSSASSAATPRSFDLVVADDVSQNALSAFIGAFIYSIVALIAIKNSYLEETGLFVLFVLTLITFGVVVLTFIRWVDRIARLGLLGNTISKVENATAEAFLRRREAPALGGIPSGPTHGEGLAVQAKAVGYVQHVDMASLQEWAEEVQGRVVVKALPGTFASPGRTLALIQIDDSAYTGGDLEPVVQAFMIGDQRRFDDDPRFGLVVLSQIASRALSPAVNDPGTAIDIIGTLVRLFSKWCEPAAEQETGSVRYDRIEVPVISVRDMFDDAFMAIGRDGAGAVEVAIRLQKALRSLASIGDVTMQDAAGYHGRQALARAEKALDFAEDLTAVREAAGIA